MTLLCIGLSFSLVFNVWFLFAIDTVTRRCFEKGEIRADNNGMVFDAIKMIWYVWLELVGLVWFLLYCDEILIHILALKPNILRLFFFLMWNKCLCRLFSKPFSDYLFCLFGRLKLVQQWFEFLNCMRTEIGIYKKSISAFLHGTCKKANDIGSIFTVRFVAELIVLCVNVIQCKFKCQCKCTAYLSLTQVLQPR